MTKDASPVRADAELLTKIAALVPHEDGAMTPLTQDRANGLLARIVWSRLLEPGDRIAGTLTAALGAEELLRLVATGATPRKILALATEAHPDLDLPQRSITAALTRWTPRLDRSKTIADIELGIRCGLRILDPESSFWPASLDDLGAHAPLALWLRGDPRLLSSCALAVVGARAASRYGTEVTAEIVEGVCAAGAPIVSGAAYGIDAVAHRTALACSAPTIAVLAGGLDRPYPEAHRELIERIATSGAVCSELAPGSAPTRWRFLQRNRLIAALAAGTLVTEAGVRSGSLNTAGHAAETGRALGAVPGPVTSSTSSGCHLLIREYGAALVASASDALELLGLSADPEIAAGSDRTTSAESRQPAAHRRLLDALPLRGTRTLPEAAGLAGLTVDEARSTMAELELLGFVSRSETPLDSETRWALERRQ